MGCVSVKKAEAELGDQQKIIDMVQHGKVFIVSKSQCPYCVQAKQILSEHSVPFEAVEVDQTRDWGSQANDWFVKTSGIRTFPKVFIGKKCIGGCSELRTALDNNTLFEMLDQENIKYEKQG